MTVETVAPGVRRLTAPNPSPMTEKGTNAYLVGETRLALIDPGPDDPAWRAELLAAIGPQARLVAILVTHTHRDHSPGARPLAEATGAPILAFGRHGDGQSETMRRLSDQGDAALLGGGEGADPDFRPDQTLADGQIAVAEDLSQEGWSLRALHTPGHLGNHLCFALERPRSAPGLLFSGDHVMGWATSLVSPPDGDMGAFMASLEKLQARQQGAAPDRLYLPGHGDPIADPAARVAELIAHRKTREAQIFEALAAGPANSAELAARIYTDIDPRLLGMAARNVLSHLIDLSEKGAIAPEGPLTADARFARI